MTPPAPPTAEPVVVVGAGLAGLHAAWRLHEAGVEVVVLEARDRVGGRTWSHELPGGAVAERGGEFIAPDDDALRGLCAELGLELVAHGFSFDRRPTPGRRAPSAEEVAGLMADASARAVERDDDVAAEDALPPPARRTPGQIAAARRLETSLTVPLRRVSARRTFGGAQHGYDPASRVRGGNQSVARELARRLGTRVRLRRPAVAVAHDERGAAVRCGDGATLSAAAVVLAVPLPLLLDLDVEPGLPPAIAAAAQRSVFGDAAKLHVPLAAAPRAGRMASPSALWWCWTSAAATGTDGAPVLSAFAGGTSAIAAVRAADGPGAWAGEVLALRPDVVATPDGAFVTHWGAEPWTRGSYFVHGIGATPDDDAAWARPWQSVALAGEHTAGARSGTMNGAVASGARAARVIADLLSARDRRPEMMRTHGDER